MTNKRTCKEINRVGDRDGVTDKDRGRPQETDKGGLRCRLKNDKHGRRQKWGEETGIYSILIYT